jgi:hypothetical protein
LRDNFGPGNPVGETSWYTFVKDVSCCSSWDGTAEITTDLYDDADAIEPARAICTAALFSEVEGLARAEVKDETGATLAECP